MPSTCPNCESQLATPPPKFCPECGQETRVRAPTLMEFAQQFGGAYLSTEGALWRTLKLLVLRPGELTAQYLRGRRKHYVLPLRLYLTISVLVLLALRAQTHVQMGDLAKDEGDGPANIQLEMLGGRAALKNGHFSCTELPAWMCTRLQRRLDKGPKQLAGEMTAYGERVVGNLGGAMFVALPAFALLTRVSWWRRGLRTTEHLVFALHLHAFWFLMLGVTLLPTGAWLAVPAALAIPVYTLLALRHVFGGRWPGLLLRSATVAIAYGAVLVLALSLLGLALLLF